MNTKTNIIVGAVIVALVFFYGGYLYGSSKAVPRGTRMMAFNGAAGNMVFGRNGGRMGNATVGSILSKDDQSMTIKLIDGGSRIVFYNGSTQVSKSVSGSLADLTIGENVMVFGSSNTDGSMTAQSVQIRPARIATSTQQ